MRSYLILFLLVVVSTKGLAGFRPKYIQIKKIEISGNEKTTDLTILRELLFEEGKALPLGPDGYNIHELISESKAALVNLNLFNQVEITHQQSDSGISIYIQVTEKWYTWPLPFLEFADRNFNQWYNFDLSPDRTNYGLYLFKYNNFGRNQTMKLSFVTGYTDLLGFEYRIPYFSKAPRWGIETKNSYKRNHEIWLTSRDDKLQFLKYDNQDMIKRLDSRLRLVFRPGQRQDFLVFETGYQNVEVADTVVNSSIFPSYLANNANEESFVLTAVEYQMERRDNKLYPTRGYHVFTRIEERFAEGKHQNFNLQANLSLHQKLSDKIHGGIGFSAYHTTLSNPHYYLLPALGYQNLIRGFEDYVITGQSYMLSQAHMKYRIHGKTHNVGIMPLKAYKQMPLAVFVSGHLDGGFTKNPEDDTQNFLQNKGHLGFGVGVDMLFYMEKLIRIDYSATSQGNHGLFVHFKKAF